MKTFFYFCFATALIALASCKGCKEKTFTTYRTVEVTTNNGETRVDTVPFRKNELIVSFSDTTSAAWKAYVRGYLLSKGFSKVDSCNCNADLELWRNGAEEVVDLIGVIAGAEPRPRGVGDGMSPNFILARPVVVNFNDDFPVSQFPVDTNDSRIKMPNGSAHVQVAIVDTGVDTAHTLLDNFVGQLPATPACSGLPVLKEGINIRAYWVEAVPRDVNGHGTLVNGIVANRFWYGGDREGVGINLLNVKFTESNTNSGSLFKATCGLYYALERDADVINISWGYLDKEAPEMMVPFLERSRRDSVVIVAGVGNDGVKLTNETRFWPAGFAANWSHVIAVGAYDPNTNAVWASSNTGDPSLVNVLAPGANVLTTYMGGGLALAEGTSMAAPHVTRTIAVMRGKRPTSTPAELRGIIEQSVQASTAPALRLFDHAQSITLTEALPQ